MITYSRDLRKVTQPAAPRAGVGHPTGPVTIPISPRPIADVHIFNHVGGRTGKSL